MRLSVPSPLLAPFEGGNGLKHAVQLKSTTPVSFQHLTSSLKPKRLAYTTQQLHSVRAQAAAQGWLPVCCELASNSRGTPATALPEHSLALKFMMLMMLRTNRVLQTPIFLLLGRDFSPCHEILLPPQAQSPARLALL